MKINNILITSFLIFFFVGLSSCTHNHSEGDGHHHGDDHGHDHGASASSNKPHAAHGEGGHEEHEEGEIFLTKEQIKTVDIQFGSFSKRKINGFINATGTLGLPPNAYSSLNAKANGFIKSNKKYVEGNYVKEGVLMAYLESADFIKIQQEYLEVAAALVFLRQDLARQEKLVAANAGVAKNLQELQSSVQVKNATLKGLEKQLSYLGINLSELSTENIVERIAITAPMSGYITSISMHNGMYVEPRKELMEIVNENHLHLELDVFEKDIGAIKKGQKISYIVPALGDKVYDGEVHVIGKEFNTQNKTVRIHGHLEKERPRFIKDLFIESKIWLDDQTVQALPEKAIIKDGASSYIYVANAKEEDKEVKFEKIMVLPKMTDKAYTTVELIEAIPAGMKIVTQGAYFVYAQSKAGELTHSH